MPSILFVTTVDITLKAFLLPFARHLRAQGWKVDALASGISENESLQAEFDETFDIRWSRNPLAPRNLFSASARVHDVVSTGFYDIVWVHTPVASYVTRRSLRFRPIDGPAVIYTAHGFHFHKGSNALTYGMYWFLEQTAAAWTDQLVTINEEDHAAACRFDTIPVERVHLVPGIGVDTNALRPGLSSGKGRTNLRKKLGATSDDVLFTMIAEFTPNKRHELALDALQLVKNDRVKLAFVGDGPLVERITSEVARRGLEQRVHFTGYRKDIDKVIAASDALLLCSKREGLNRSALEGMASGVPIVGTPTRGIADAIGDNEAGWIAKSHQAEDLAAAIDTAARNADERARRGAAARERAVERFSLTGVIAAYDGIFTAAMDQRAAVIGRSRSTYDSVKAVLDFVCALLLTVILSPLLALVALGVLVMMGGPVLFRQERPGRDAKPFTLYKFRTMRAADSEASDVDAVGTDKERLTGFGRFLRATSLDELPQLFNILKGDMSFVGPRPLLTEYLEVYTPEQAKRHRAKPGMTGWAQVNGRNAASWEDRLAMDAFYADHYSPILDTRIVLKTIATVFSRKGISAEGQATVEPLTAAVAAVEDPAPEADELAPSGDEAARLQEAVSSDKDGDA